ncbi:MAG: alpha/beta hydrolase, partial [Synechococcales bacterium]|nr:alpha/beta hydrolase [Synechococcales bacterium]
MQHCVSWFEGLDGMRLFYQSWSPDELPQAVVITVHGLGSHSGLFAPATDYLVEQGYVVYGFDLRGHGRSPGQRGHINHWTEFREDLRRFIQRIRDKHPVCPCFLWGHSLGGTIALDYTLRSPESIAGLIVTAPALNGVKVPLCKRWLGRLLSRILPQFSLRVGLKKHPILADPTLQLLYEQDPLRHEYGSARLATEFFTTADWI